MEASNEAPRPFLNRPGAASSFSSGCSAENLILVPLKNRVFYVQKYGFHSIDPPIPLSAPTSTQGALIPMVPTPESSLAPPKIRPSKEISGVIFLQDARKLTFSLLYEIGNTLCALISQSPHLLLNRLGLSVCRFREKVSKPALVPFLLLV